MSKTAMTAMAHRWVDRGVCRLRKGEQRAAEGAEQIRQLEALAKTKGEEAKAKGEEAAAKAQAKGGELTKRGLRRLGGRLSQGRSAELLGIQPARRRLSLWAVALGGIAVGYVAGLLTAPKRGAELRGALASSAKMHGAPSATGPPPLAETIRSELTGDPRTAQLPELEVNVAQGTVFVRGNVPRGFDEQVLREVISKVPGVSDVDLQVTASA